jgi:NADH dehydrogenase [ubiquinone] 1 alpha subcomplex assembly factor 5
MSPLSPGIAQRTSGRVTALFDIDLRSRRRDRASRIGPELFLAERVFADCLDRLTLVPRGFANALLIGCPDPEWPARLPADRVDVRDPGPLFAECAGGELIIEDDWSPNVSAYDLVLAIGTLDTVNDLPRALRLLFEAMTSDALLIGAVSGGNTLPRLRGAMRAADAASDTAVPHVHPRIEASALAPLLSGAGFTMPVVDVDRVEVRYRGLRRLVNDLRAMGATNVLTERPRRFLSAAAYRAARQAFADKAADGRTTEVFEILHFAAWKGSQEVKGR